MAWKSVYSLVKRVPKGRVITYGRLARALGLPGGARTAGRALAACPNGRGIPWHRVVGAGGHILLREPFAGLQKRLLGGEGVGFVGGPLSVRVDIAHHEWAPPKRIVPRKAKKPARK